MTHDELARRFAELNNIHWNDNPKLYVRPICLCKNRNRRCKDCMYSVNTGSPNPTYSTVGSVLEVMMEREDFQSFITINDIGISYCDKKGKYLGCSIYIEFIMEKDKLLTAAVAWCKDHKVKEK